ncbi:hypothetical protein [Vreelandella titanicae]|uniref:hypothetical protein n=1 Tax=Vreelandella titanicae TaxID=664683 RepID=UPI0039BF89F2
MKITDRLVPRDRYHVSGIDPVKPSVVEKPPQQDDTFTHAASEARQRGSNRPAWAERLEALARPEAIDPASYTNLRSIELLQHVADKVLPTLDADDEIMALALAEEVIGEEIDWRQAWEGRMSEASALPLDNIADQESVP